MIEVGEGLADEMSSMHADAFPHQPKKWFEDAMVNGLQARIGKGFEQGDVVAVYNGSYSSSWSRGGKMRPGQVGGAVTIARKGIFDNMMGFRTNRMPDRSMNKRACTDGCKIFADLW